MRPGGESGGYAEMPLYICKDAVAQGASFADIARTKRKAQTLCRGIRLVHRDMAPPHASVVPEVMVLVVIVDTKSNLGLLCGHHRRWVIEKGGGICNRAGRLLSGI